MRARFILSQIAAGLRANLAMAISVVLVTFVSLTFVGAGILLQMQIGKLKDDWYDKVEISVFMCPSDSLQASCAGGEATQAQLDERSEERRVGKGVDGAGGRGTEINCDRQDYMGGASGEWRV